MQRDVVAETEPLPGNAGVNWLKPGKANWAHCARMLDGVTSKRRRADHQVLRQLQSQLEAKTDRSKTLS